MGAKSSSLVAPIMLYTQRPSSSRSNVSRPGETIAPPAQTFPVKPTHLKLRQKLWRTNTSYQHPYSIAYASTDDEPEGSQASNDSTCSHRVSSPYELNFKSNIYSTKMNHQIVLRDRFSSRPIAVLARGKIRRNGRIVFTISGFKPLYAGQAPQRRFFADDMESGGRRRKYSTYSWAYVTQQKTGDLVLTMKLLGTAKAATIAAPQMEYQQVTNYSHGVVNRTNESFTAVIVDDHVFLGIDEPLRIKIQSADHQLCATMQQEINVVAKHSKFNFLQKQQNQKEACVRSCLEGPVWELKVAAGLDPCLMICFAAIIDEIVEIHNEEIYNEELISHKKIWEIIEHGCNPIPRLS